jgi:hypothetical protein
MTITRLAGALAVGVALFAPEPASAAWNNVFQLTCCNKPRASMRQSFFAPAPAPTTCCAPPPPACCPQTAYVQRSYYQPVTAYKPVMTCEPVVSYRTSYYYEPVTTYSYSMYVDPCTGCAQQVARPCTSYQLRQQCNAVTSYVQRVSYQPVTAYRHSFYLEPVTVDPCGGAMAAAPAPVATSPPVTLGAPPAAAPGTTDQIVPQQPQPGAYQPPLNPNEPPRAMPPSTSEKILPQTSAPARRPAPVAPWRPDQIASRGSTVTGTIVRADNRPQPGARVRFVSANGTEAAPVTADAAGRFQVALASGAWKIVTDDGSGQTLSYNLVVGTGDRNVMLVSR